MQRHNQVWGMLIILGWVAVLCLAEYGRQHGFDWREAWSAAKLEAIRWPGGHSSPSWPGR